MTFTDNELGRVLVTGSSGFIGSHLVRSLSNHGLKVRSFDANPNNGDLASAGVEALVGDIRDRSQVESAAADIDVIFHLAALASVQQSVADPQLTIDSNISGTLNVLEAARHSGVRRVVFASTAAVYGDSERPCKSERDTPQPESPYAVSKLAGEQLGAIYAQLYGIETISLRFFNVYGPGQNPNSPYSGVISKFVHAIQTDTQPTIFGDGSQTRDFVYVGDVVEALMLASSATPVPAHPLNVASGTATSLNDLWESIRNLSNSSIEPKRLPAKPGDIEHSLADVSRARTALGFEASTSLQEGLSKLLATTVP